MCMKYLGLGEPTAMQYAIADTLQNETEDIILQAGRGTGKSTITACLPSWYFLRDINTTFVVLSNSSPKAIEFVSQAKKVLQLVPYCKHIAPRKGLERDNALSFNVRGATKHTQDYSCSARGITGQITGLHADKLILDDIEVSGKNATQTTKEILLAKLKETVSIKNTGGQIIYLGTPHFTDSVYNTLGETHRTIKYPAEMPDPDIKEEMENIAPWILDLDIEPGAPTQPERFDATELAIRKAKIGPSVYAMQYKLITTFTDRDKYPLRLNDLIVFDVPRDIAPATLVWQGKNQQKDIPSFGLSGDYIPEPMFIGSDFIPQQNMHLSIDPKGRGEDQTGLCVASTSGGRTFIHELIGLSGGYDDVTISKIMGIIKEYGIKLVRIESNYGDGMFTKILLPHIMALASNCGIEEFKVSGNKENRIIDNLEPVMHQHRLVFDRRAIREKENQIQITRIFRSRDALKHDDRIDALSNAVEYYKPFMALDSVTFSEEFKKKVHEKEVEKWRNNFRASDYYKHSGCVKQLSKKPNKMVPSQWGW